MKKRQVIHRFAATRRLLELLQDLGPTDRMAMRKLAREAACSLHAGDVALLRMREQGLVDLVYRLTPRGRRELKRRKEADTA